MLVASAGFAERGVVAEGALAADAAWVIGTSGDAGAAKHRNSRREFVRWRVDGCVGDLYA